MNLRLLLLFIAQLLWLTIPAQSNKQPGVLLTGELPGSGGDTIKVFLNFNPVIQQVTTYTVPVVEGKWRLSIPLDQPVLTYIRDSLQGYHCLLEPGDSLHLVSMEGNLRFSGKGAEKASFLMDFRRYDLYKKIRTSIPRFKQGALPFDALFTFIDSATGAFMERLQSIKTVVSPESFNLLRAEILAGRWSQRYRGTTMLYHETIDQTLTTRTKELSPSSTAILQNMFSLDESLYFSSTYLMEVYNIFFVQYDGRIMEGKATKNLPDKYAYLRKHLPSRLTVPVLTLFLESDIRKLNQAEDLETLIRETYQSPADSTYKNYIGQYYSQVTSFKTGMSAPEFTLENEAGEQRQLADFRGKVVFLDFWYGACIPCHALFEALAPVKHHFAGNPNVVFLNISIDPRQVWLAALKKFKVPGYHVFTEGKGGDHPVIKSYKVMGYPTTCLIDRQGNIFLATPSSSPAELIAQIENALGK